VSGAAWIVLAALAVAPLGLVAWVRWRFGARQMNAHADKLNADAKARMKQLDDAALIARFSGLGDSPAARRIRGLVDERRFDELQRDWGDLWPELLREKLTLDDAIELGAAIHVLASRHPA
jgi:hypothetical protein